MKKKIVQNISDLILEDDDFYCFINPFYNIKKPKQDKSESIASFIEKRNKINKISIKIKNKELKEKINSLVTKKSDEQEKNNRKDNLVINNLSPKFSYKNLKSLKYKLSSKKNKIFLELIPFNLKRNKSNSKLNFLNDYEKLFFFDIDYSGLKYNGTEIFSNKSRYQKIIIDKIDLLKKGIFDKKTIKLEKDFIYGSEGKKINLSLTSLTISIEDMALPPEKQNKNLKLNLPFSLLPLFYYKGIDIFQKLLAFIIKVGKDFEKISFDEKALEIALDTISEYQFNEQQFKTDQTNCKDNLKYEDLFSPILKRNNNFLNFNTFIFFWVTNTKSLVTKVSLPCIHLDILDNNITIKSYIDYELLFYLFEKDFQYWEFYIIKYLSTYSKYRNIFEQLDSNSKINNQTFYFKEPKIKMNTFAQEVLYNMYTDQMYRNQVIVFNSFYLVVNLIDEIHSLKKNFRIYFSFFQYVKLYEIAKYANKIDFLSKFIKKDTETHTLKFDFKEYDLFDANIWMENIKKFAGNSIKKDLFDFQEELNMEFEVYNKKVKIEYKKPVWSIIKFEKAKEIDKTWKIGKEMEYYLIESIVNPNGGSWTKFLNECLEKIENDEESTDISDTRTKLPKMK